ncbi:MAG: carbohydrate ABC transporter permease [Spirochaetaceae bacterium]|nr:carbohydrate ABC transporter permease [Spirochaetaceae bacterium]
MQSHSILINRSRRNRIDVVRIITYVLFGLLALIIIVPFYWMMNASTLSVQEITGYPPHLLPGTHFKENLVRLFDDAPFARNFLNSVFVAASVTVAQLFLCSLAGYAFALYDFPGRKKLFILMLATMMIPTEMNLIPSYIMMAKFGWLDSFRALIVPSTVTAFGIFWMRMSFADAVPKEIVDAARIDGSSDFGTYVRIAVPLAVPAMGVLGLLTFVNSWNDYLAPLIYLTTPEKYTLPLTLITLNTWQRSGIGAVMVGATLASLPVLIVFFLASKQIIKGLTSGALKG